MYNFAFTNKHIVENHDTIALLIIEEILFYVMLLAFYNLLFKKEEKL